MYGRNRRPEPQSRKQASVPCNGNDRIQHCIVGISEEYGLDVGIVHTDMLHAVFFLVAAGKLMLLDNAVRNRARMPTTKPYCVLPFMVWAYM